jgi:hypothetical protein
MLKKFRYVSLVYLSAYVSVRWRLRRETEAGQDLSDCIGRMDGAKHSHASSTSIANQNVLCVPRSFVL